MADKKSPASGWPLVKGDFISGDANSPVAIVTMGSHLDEKGLCDAGAALCGSCKTENLGLEKVIANVISNPNIRFILFCGTEVKGHLSGQTFGALHKNGVKDGRVVGAEGAIPFIENLNDAAIKRFQEQTEIVNIMESEDLNAINAKINELKARTRARSLLTQSSSKSRKLPVDRKSLQQVQIPSSSRSRRGSTRSRRISSSWMRKLRSVLGERSDGISAFCTAWSQVYSYS